MGVDLALGPMWQGLASLEFASSDWHVGLGTWHLDLGLGGWALRLRSALGT